MIFAVDFDGTLIKNNQPNTGLIAQLVGLQYQGHKIIMHTCRTGKSLNEAVRWSKAHGLVFNAVYGGKPYADFYLDDKAVKV